VNWVWLSRDALLAAHAEQLAAHGGDWGFRDESLFDWAFARPKHLAAHGGADVFDLAAAYGYGLARQRPMQSGNDALALLAAEAFLALNGYRLEASEIEVAETFARAGAGEIDRLDLEDWLARNSVPA
jgi:death on curing protein